MGINCRKDNKDTKLQKNTLEQGFNEYNLMSFTSYSSYQEYLKNLKEDQNKLVKNLASKFEEKYYC